MVYNTPQWAEERIKYDLGIYLQDSFAYKRLTINPGIRFEAFNTFVPEQGSPAGRFVPLRHFDKIENLPNWRDVAPRFGAVYDVFDDGKTAIKLHVGKYMRSFSTVGFAAIYNPMVIASDRRTWADRNGDDIAQDSEIGPPGYSVQHQRRQQPRSRPRHQAALSVGVQPRCPARVVPGCLDVVRVGASRLQAPVLDRQHAGVATATTPS